MRKIKNKNLAQLLMQLRFSPAKKRQKQLDSAEKLLAIIEKNRQYPFEFICFRITGFRPKAVAGRQLIKGDQLIDDLGIFISKLSNQLNDHVRKQKQKVYTVDELAAMAGVSTKTIHRWRKKGLAARRFIFDDGIKRFGFLQSTVNKFLMENKNLIANAKTFSRLTKKQKQSIIKRATTLAAKGTLSRHQIISQIAKQIGRAHETIRYIILNYENTHPEKPVFGGPPGAISPAKANELYKLFKNGCSIKELMKGFKRTRSSIYRIINSRRAKEILRRKIEFIPSDEFLQDRAQGEILTKPIPVKSSLSKKGIEPFEMAGASLLPEYLQRLKDTPILNRRQEVQLFRRYNYLKYLASITRAGLKPEKASSTRLEKIENYLAEAEKIKKTITEANLRLVVSIASKHISAETSLADLISKGNLALVKQVEKFDYTKGYRFSGLASWAIAKEYARKFPADTARPDKVTAASMEDIQRDLRISEAADIAAIERARQSLVLVIKDDLDEREQYIILNHFGLVGSVVKKKKKTLKQIGDDLGLTKERVRQLELSALQKLRQSLSIEEFELLKG